MVMDEVEPGIPCEEGAKTGGGVTGTSGAQTGPDGDTVYFRPVDNDGLIVSAIQSIYHDFGCAEIAGDTRIIRRGQPIEVLPGWDDNIGHAQAIRIDRETGLLEGGADPRGDGVAHGF